MMFLQLGESSEHRRRVEYEHPDVGFTGVQGIGLF